MRKIPDTDGAQRWASARYYPTATPIALKTGCGYPGDKHDPFPPTTLDYAAEERQPLIGS